MGDARYQHGHDSRKDRLVERANGGMGIATTGKRKIGTMKWKAAHNPAGLKSHH